MQKLGSAGAGVASGLDGAEGFNGSPKKLWMLMCGWV